MKNGVFSGGTRLLNSALLGGLMVTLGVVTYPFIDALGLSLGIGNDGFMVSYAYLTLGLTVAGSLILFYCATRILTDWSYGEKSMNSLSSLSILGQVFARIIPVVSPCVRCILRTRFWNDRLSTCLRLLRSLSCGHTFAVNRHLLRAIRRNPRDGHLRYPTSRASLGSSQPAPPLLNFVACWSKRKFRSVRSVISNQEHRIELDWRGRCIPRPFFLVSDLCGTRYYRALRWDRDIIRCILSRTSSDPVRWSQPTNTHRSPDNVRAIVT